MTDGRSFKLEEFFKQYDLEKVLDFLRTIFRWHYCKTRGDDGVYIWYGDNDGPMETWGPLVHLGRVSLYFVNYTEDEVIEKYSRYYNLKAFL